MRARRRGTRRRGPAPSALLARADGSLLELVDHVLNQGVVITGDLMLGVADVDLVYVRVSALLCAADRVLPPRELRELRELDAGDESDGAAPAAEADD